MQKASRTFVRRRPAALPEPAFINNKLTAELTRQLEPMIVARYSLLGNVLAVLTSFYSVCLPGWAVDLPQHYPFLFLFTRFSFLQSTSFEYARLILKWQDQQTTAGARAAMIRVVI
jgi:E3 ubiquitin-protein ligase TRIP12